MIDGVRRPAGRISTPFFLLALVGSWFVTIPAPAEQTAEPVGSETCAGCHEERVEDDANSVHWRTDPEGSCENCHGPGSLHVEEADPAAILQFVPATPADERSSACLACHARDESHSRYDRSDHALGGIACNDCHGAHDTKHPRLLHKKDPELCFGCHGPIVAQFAFNERHPLLQGGMDCADCHDPHAASLRTQLGGFKQELCLSCHSEYRGPWVFEHEAVTIEGCIACHAPHGSPNRHLLTYERAGDLCLQCHPAQPVFHMLTDNPTRQRTTGFNDCTRCHTEIHGSNNDALFLN